jgi:hypothetical protein
VKICDPRLSQIRITLTSLRTYRRRRERRHDDLAKGLEFRVVAVMACDDEVLPLQSRIEGVGEVAIPGGVRHGATVAVRGRALALVTGCR